MSLAQGLASIGVLVISMACTHEAWSSSVSQDSSASFEGINVHYKDIGVGRDVLLFVHGWTCNLTFWHQSLNAFPGYRVIAVDLPGHGESDKPNLEYSMDYFAGSLDAVLKKAGVRRAVIIGHSMGTAVAYAFYRKHPDKVVGMVLVDGMPWAVRKQDRAALGRLIEQYGRDYHKTLESTVGKMIAPIADARLRNQISSQMASTPEFVGYSAVRAMIEPDLAQLTDAGELVSTASEVIVPVLAIFAGGGEGHASWWPDDTEKFLSKAIKDLDFRLWRDVSHFLMMERPGAFNQAVSSFAHRVFAREAMGE